MIRILLLLVTFAWPVTRTHQELIDLAGRKGDITHLYDLYTRAGWATPQEHGAACDGSSDDTQEIAAAIATGLPVLFPRGTCLVSGALTFTKGAHFLSGAAIKWTGTGYAVAFDHIQAGPYRIFDVPTSNPPTLTNAKTWCAKWFARLGVACTTMQTGQSLFLHDGDYAVTSPIDLSGKAFFSIEGETMAGVRLIPTSNLTSSGNIAADTCGGVAGAYSPGAIFVLKGRCESEVRRKIMLRRLTFFSSNAYAIADFGLYARWIPELFLEELNFINVSKLYSVYFNTVFVVTLKNCNGVGSEAFSSSQWNSTPGPLAGGTGFYCENTTTTLEMSTCRWQYYPGAGVRLQGVDAATIMNTAMESCDTAGIQIDGGSLNVNLIGNYFEGNNGTAASDIEFTGTAYSPLIQGNYLHGGRRGITFRAGITVEGAGVRSNHFFSGDTGLLDRGAALKQLVVDNNTFRSTSVSGFFTQDTVEANRRIVWRNNVYASSPEVLADQTQLSTEGLGSYSASGGATVTGDARRVRNDSVWRVTGTGLDYVSRSLFSISSTVNPNLRGQWVTVSVPVLGNVAGSPQLLVLDGVETKTYTLTASTSWRDAVVYKKLDASATGLELRFRAAGDTLYAGRPSVRLGFFDGSGHP